MRAQSDERKSAGSKGRGEARPGSGRKPGSVNKRTREIADKAAAEGITPIEVQLATMRELWKQANVGGMLDIDKAVAASAIAKDAAPYIHPRLASIEGSFAVTNHEAALDELK
jgi:hypothetical protein